MENFTMEKRQLCDIQGRLFELAVKNGLDSPAFMETFMNSRTAAALDDVYDRLQWAAWTAIKWPAQRRCVSAGWGFIRWMSRWPSMI